MSGGPGATAPVVIALARIEGRKLLGHPVMLAGVAFLLIGGAFFLRTAMAGSAISWDEDGWTVFVGAIFLGTLAMVATNNAALRDRREHTREQHTSLPAREGARTGGLLAATLWPAAVAALLLTVIVALAGARGIVLASDETVHLVEGVLTILLLGVMGIALAAWLPSPFIAPLVAWAVVFVTPGEIPRSWHALTLFAGLRSVELALWHLVYLLGLTAVIALVALARSTRPRRLVLPGLIAIGAVAVAAVILLTRACPATGACLL